MVRMWGRLRSWPASTPLCKEPTMTEQIKDIKRQIKELRAEMRAAGIRRTSCFNGGLDPQTYRLNAQMFALETKRSAREGDVCGASQARAADEESSPRSHFS